MGGCGKDPEPEPVEDKYTVSFNANGGSGTMASVADVKGDYVLPQSTFTAPEGNHFTGWKVNNEGELKEVGATIQVNANVAVYAQWTLTT